MSPAAHAFWPRPMLLLHLSDIHFGAEDRVALAALARWRTEHACDLAVIAGDLTLGGARREFAAAAEWLGALGLPFVIAAGNHDVPKWNLWSRAVGPFRRYERLAALGQRSAITPLATVVSLQTAHGLQWRLNWSHGAVRQRHLVPLIAQLRAGEARPWGVLACHHPLIDPPGMPVSGRTRRAQAAIDQLSAEGINLVLTGHVHVPIVQPYPQDASRLVMVGAGTLSDRTRGVPASFNTLALSADAVQVTIWTLGPDGFAPHETVVLPRPARAQDRNDASPV